VSSIIMRITESASVKARQSGLPIEPLAIAQVAVAALVGTGVNSFEAAVRWKVPFFVSAPPYRAHEPESNFPLDAVFDRSKQMLVRAHGRSAGPLEVQSFSEIELEVQATALGVLVIEEVKTAGLSVYTQKLLFAQEFQQRGRDILKGLVHRGTKVTRASVAIASGMIPPLPSNSTKEHLIFLGPKATHKHNNPTFSQWVTKGETLLVEFPMPDMEPSDGARYDYFNAVGRGASRPNPSSAGIGLGFFVVRQERMAPSSSYPNGRPYFHVLTPQLHYSGGEKTPWSWPQFEANTIHEYFRDPSSYNKFAKQLNSKGRSFIAKLNVCPGCNEIYSDARADLKKRCDCVSS